MIGGIALVIQARTGSARLPGKVLADVGGRPMLRFQLDRLARLPCDHLVVATSTRDGDDAIATLATDAGAAVVRGPEDDVLARFGMVVDQLHPATVVRLTGDCPLSDPGIIAEVIALHESSGADYTSNVHPRSFPKGLDVEVVSAAALSTAVAEASDAFDREHVTPFFYKHPERFRIANLSSGQGLEDLWWTVDTADDLQHIRRMVGALADPVAASWTAILEATRRAGLS